MNNKKNEKVVFWVKFGPYYLNVFQSTKLNSILQIEHQFNSRIFFDFANSTKHPNQKPIIKVKIVNIT